MRVWRNENKYGYDNASRLSSVNDGNNNAATYSYLANSPLVSQITFKQSGITRMTTSKSYDYLDRLTAIASQANAAYTAPLTYNYNYNPANQRTKDTLADGSYWMYSYDLLGQVTNGCKYFSNGTLVPGQQFDYTFDTIGNRTQTKVGGDTNGANLRAANYYANNLNQLTNRDIPAYVDVMGASLLTNAVTVNGQTAYRNQEYYREQIPANNSTSALWTNIVVSGGQSVTGNVYVAQEPEVFQYDPDGNVTNDGRWSYTWDGENRLVQMTVNTNAGPQYTLTFAYDPKGRRIQKLVVSNSVALYTNNFLYDGWNLIATLNPSTLLESFVWGNDLSDSQQGAGGVAGMLEVSYYGSSTTNCFPAYDGNGNVMALVNAVNGTLVANYDYGPFGEPIRITGSMGKNNPFRFSTKYDDDEDDLLYYGYRYYKASAGTWLNRDPLYESGFKLLLNKNANRIHGSLNLYNVVNNDPIMKDDVLGLALNCCCDSTSVQIGLLTLTERWYIAIRYLDAHGVKLDPYDQSGVSCLDSANHILTFMSPTPRCWLCYIQTRWSSSLLDLWNENSIVCDSVNPNGGNYHIVFDWWHQKYHNLPYAPYSWNDYVQIYPYSYPTDPGAWWYPGNFAPHDDCNHNSSFPVENFTYLQGLLPPYSK